MAVSTALLTVAGEPALSDSVPATGKNAPGSSPSRSPTLWYDTPAREWLEALPIGNGRVGAMVFGGVASEQIQLNEQSIWAGGPHRYDHPGASESLHEIRRLIFAGEWGKAHELTDSRLMGRPVSQAPYQTVGSLFVEFANSDSAEPVVPAKYRRALDLDTAIATTSYTVGDTRYTRETFASYPDQVIVMRLSADKPGRLNFGLRYEAPAPHESTTPSGDMLVLDGGSTEGGGEQGQVRFQARTRLLPEGKSAKILSDGQGRLSVSGADAVTILVSVATNFVSYKDLGADPEKRARAYLDAAARRPYSQLRERHLRDYQPLFRRVALSLGPEAATDRPTGQRIADFARNSDPSLVALHFQFGRYLLIASSRPGGTEPATLQGLWNDRLNPPWGSKFTININTEMNYWPAAPANLLECYEPLFGMLHDLAATGAATAKEHYGAGGWVAHHNTNGWRGTAPVDGSFWGTWPTGGAWLCKSVRDYYDFTGDRAFLDKHYPVLKGAAQFFVDTLVEDPESKHLVTCPSISPENAHHRQDGKDVSLCAGPTMDNQILRDLFDSVILFSEELNRDAVFREQVRAVRGRLAPMKVGKQGQLQEWQEDWDGEAPEQHHRHVSHLYGLFPSNQISPEKTPDLFAAARKSLELRGDMATGWSLAWKINLWARLREGDRAHDLIQGLLSPGRTAPNLFDLHPPFQIDGNFGATSGICEMLVQSHADEIHLLPALPAKWDTGSVRGLRARGGFEVDLSWKAGKVTRATIRAITGSPACTVRVGDRRTVLALKKGGSITLDGNLNPGR